MSVSYEQLKTLLKTTPYPFYRDKAKKGQEYPYIVCTHISESHKRASGSIYKKMPQYQISLFTAGIETDFNPITKVLNDNKIPFSTLNSIQGDENDDTVTNFFIKVRAIEDV